VTYFPGPFPLFMTAVQGRNKGRAIRGVGLGSWNNQKYGAPTFKFATRQIISQTFAVWARAVRKVRQSCPRPKTFKGYRFDGAPNYWPACCARAGPDAVVSSYVSLRDLWISISLPPCPGIAVSCVGLIRKMVDK